MKAKAGKWLAGVLVLLVALLVALPVAQPVAADEPQPLSPGPGLQLPDDLADDLANGAQEHSVPYQEHRVGGRLERITVTRENGFTEIYRNNRPDTVWSAQENEIGEVPNMRQWIIGTW